MRPFVFSIYMYDRPDELSGQASESTSGFAKGVANRDTLLISPFFMVTLHKDSLVRISYSSALGCIAKACDRKDGG